MNLPVVWMLIAMCFVPVAWAQESQPTTQPATTQPATTQSAVPQLAVPQVATQPAAAPSGPVRVVLNARALDYSQMLRQSHGGHQQGQTPPPLTPVALADASLMVLVRGLPNGPRQVAARSNAQGSFGADLGELPAGSVVEFLADRKTSEGLGDKYYARSFEVGTAAPPGDVSFYRVARDSTAIVQEVMQIVTRKEEKSASGEVVSRSVQVRQIVYVANVGFEVWLGDVNAPSPVSYWLPFPEGFELVAGGITVNNRPIEVTAEPMPHGGRGYAQRRPLFPAFGDDTHQFVAVFGRPYQDGATYDLGMHVEYATQSYSLNLEEGAFAYLPPANASHVALKDIGSRGAMGQTQKVTRGFLGESIRAHATIAGRVLAGKAPVEGAVWITLSCIAFVVVGGLAFGFFFGGRGKPAPAATDPIAAGLALLDQRKQRGEITSVEHAARRAVLLGTAVGAPPPLPADALPADALLAAVDEIANRAPSGADSHLGEDVRVLAHAVRAILAQKR